MTSSKETKPREWWVGERSLIANVVNTWDEYQNYIHVIEHSAYKQLAAELAEVKRELSEKDAVIDSFVKVLGRQVGEDVSLRDFKDASTKARTVMQKWRKS